MIFVTVGTIEFDQLVKTVDQAVASGRLKHRVVVQLAHGSYLPVHAEYFTTKPSLSPYYDQAELVIGHGGTGTTLEVVERGLRLISVANPAMKDNHQHEFLEIMERNGYLWYCRDLAGLSEMIEQVLTHAPKPRLEGHLGARISRDFESWEKPTNKRSSSLLQKWASRILSRSRLPVGALDRQASVAQGQDLELMRVKERSR